MRVVVVGLGRIGSRIARSLAEVGHEVGGHDTDRERLVRRDELGMADDTPGGVIELAEWADATVVAVPGPVESQAVALDPATGFVARMQRGGLYVDCTTNSIDAVRRIAAVADRRGVLFVDAPLSGLPPHATAMVGGDRAAVEAARELLHAFCARVHVVGLVGSGTAVKLANQHLGFSTFIAACEAFALLRQSHVDLQEAAAALSSSFGSSRALEAYVTHVLGGDLDATSGTLAIVRKDMDLVGRAFEEAGLESPGLVRVVDLFRRASDLGWGDRGFARVAQLVDPDSVSGRTGTGSRRTDLSSDGWRRRG